MLLVREVSLWLLILKDFVLMSKATGSDLSFDTDACVKFYGHRCLPAVLASVEDSEQRSRAAWALLPPRSRAVKHRLRTQSACLFGGYVTTVRKSPAGRQD